MPSSTARNGDETTRQRLDAAYKNLERVIGWVANAGGAGGA